VDRAIKQGRENARSKAVQLFQLALDEEKAKEVQKIAHGVFSPLQGGYINISRNDENVSFRVGMKIRVSAAMLPCHVRKV